MLITVLSILPDIILLPINLFRTASEKRTFFENILGKGEKAGKCHVRLSHNVSTVSEKGPPINDTFVL